MAGLRYAMGGNPGMAPVTGTRHQIISLRIAAALLQYTENGTPNSGRVLQAPCNVILSSEFIIQPDIVLVHSGRSGVIGEKCLRGIPDLIIEILSPETREQDIKTKRSLYSRFQVKEYWIVDPDPEIVEVLAWSELGYATAGRYRKLDLLTSLALPGFRLPLRKVFGNGG